MGGQRISNPKTVLFKGFQGIHKWDVSSVTSLRLTFSGAVAMDADLSKWNVGKVRGFINEYVSVNLNRMRGAGERMSEGGEVSDEQTHTPTHPQTHTHKRE